MSEEVGNTRVLFGQFKIDREPKPLQPLNPEFKIDREPKPLPPLNPEFKIDQEHAGCRSHIPPSNEIIQAWRQQPRA